MWFRRCNLSTSKFLLRSSRVSGTIKSDQQRERAEVREGIGIFVVSSKLFRRTKWRCEGEEQEGKLKESNAIFLNRAMCKTNFSDYRKKSEHIL